MIVGARSSREMRIGSNGLVECCSYRKIGNRRRVGRSKAEQDVLGASEAVVRQAAQ